MIEAAWHTSWKMVTPSGGTNTHSYFHANRQGSIVAMSADNGTMSEGLYTYDAYGNGAPTTGVPFKYTGRRLDPETGLYYYRARYYSASLGGVDRLVRDASLCRTSAT